MGASTLFASAPELIEPGRAGEGRARVIIESVSPEIDSGRYPIKRVIGEIMVVEADIFADGHDKLSAAFAIRQAGDTEWTEAP